MSVFVAYRSVCGIAEKSRLFPILFQTRDKGHLNRPRLRNPFWFVQKTVSQRDNKVTLQNKAFIKEIESSTSGSSAVVKMPLHYAQTEVPKSEKPEQEQSVNKLFQRPGVIAKKIGQYPLWLKNGTKIRTTLLQVIDNSVIKYITPEENNRRLPNGKVDRRDYVLIGAGSANPSLLSKEYCGLFRESNVAPKQLIARFIVSSKELIPGTELDVSHFKVGQYVDVRGKTVYRGFQGVCKRHGFKGMGASHGVTKTHRRPGNIGGGGEKGRVWPGTKLPGHMGNRYRVAKGLKIWRINTKYNVMWVTGSAIPGETNGIVRVFDTVLPLRRKEKELPPPTTDGNNIISPEVHNFKSQTIVFTSE